MSDPYHTGHPKIPAAIDGTGKALSALQNAGIPDTVIAEAMLQEVVWMMENYDPTTAEAAALRGIISWFSGECASLIAPSGPPLSRIGWH
jgi:hypothetical protein